MASANTSFIGYPLLQQLTPAASSEPSRGDSQELEIK
jgi:hypothetical protein